MKHELWKKMKFWFWQIAETIAYINLLLILIYSHQLGWRIFALIDILFMVLCNIGLTLCDKDEDKTHDS